jgi:hypothetical protein
MIAVAPSSSTNLPAAQAAIDFYQWASSTPLFENNVSSFMLFSSENAVSFVFFVLTSSFKKNLYLVFT